MDTKYIDQSLGTKPWVKALAIIDPQTAQPVYAWGDTCNAAHYAESLMDKSNKSAGRTGAWHTGAFLDDDTLDIALAREVGGYTVLVETTSGQEDFPAVKRGAKKLAHAARHALKSAGMLGPLYENC
ncbi:MAG: hypothetical protein HY516_05090 [Candidatus Aenigmarchaeota archaeon]|nr:hypothetical protein [Candidatus Aenigmarchaeota archaeon]